MGKFGSFWYIMGQLWLILCNRKEDVFNGFQLNFIIKWYNNGKIQYISRQSSI